MHLENHKWLKHNKNLYPHYFDSSEVLECGSANINGTVRDYFTNNKKFIGVDWRDAKDVDLVSLVHNLNLSDKFDVVISCSMLEHDPYWDLSIAKMHGLLKDSGVLFLVWQCLAGYRPHELYTAPDGKYHGLSGSLVYDMLKNKLGMHVHEFRYEHNFMGYQNITNGSSGGMIVSTSFKDQKYAVGSKIIDEMLLEDKVK